MRIFVTGATGFVGSTVVEDLLRAGHEVLGLARSDDAAERLAAVGADVHRGDLRDPDSLLQAARQVDGVIHTGFIYDFARLAENCRIDREAIEALGEALAGSGRPLVVTSAIGVPSEDDPAPSGPDTPPRVSEQTALSFVDRGVRATVVRLPQVHDPRKQGIVTVLIEIARQKGVSAYAGDGTHRWCAVHRQDVAPLYRLALEKGMAGGRYHAIAEQGVAARDVAEAIGNGLNLPVVSLPFQQAMEHFGALGWFAVRDTAASSVLTQQRLGWHPTDKPGLIADVLDAARARARR